MKMTIGKRITFGFVLLIILIISLGMFALSRLNGLGTEATNVTDNSLPSVYITGQVQICAIQNFSRLFRSLLLEDPALLSKLNADIKNTADRYTHLMKDYEGMISSDKERSLFNAVEDARKPYFESRAKVLALSDAGKKKEADALAEDEMLPRMALP